jgi:hypothetical protein
MKPITVAVVGDDPHALRVLAKLHELDPTKIIVVGHAPQIYERPFQSDPFEFMSHHEVQPLIYPKKEVLAVSEKMLALLKRAA